MSQTESSISSASSVDGFCCDTVENQRDANRQTRSAGGDVLSDDAASTQESQSSNGLDWISTKAPPEVLDSAGRSSLEDDEGQAEEYFLAVDLEEQTSNQEDEDLVVLAPDHPLLSNFHLSVFNHLSKQKQLLEYQIKEMVKFALEIITKNLDFFYIGRTSEEPSERV